MGRSRASAKAAGTRAETLVAKALAEGLGSDHIERRTLTGSKDRGDVGGVRAHGQRVVVEVKDVTAMQLGAWVSEAETERVNDGALVGLCVHKRRGKGDPLDWYTTMTLRDLIALMTGTRPGSGGTA